MLSISNVLTVTVLVHWICKKCRQRLLNTSWLLYFIVYSYNKGYLVFHFEKHYNVLLVSFWPYTVEYIPLWLYDTFMGHASNDQKGSLLVTMQYGKVSSIPQIHPLSLSFLSRLYLRLHVAVTRLASTYAVLLQADWLKFYFYQLLTQAMLPKSCNTPTIQRGNT